MIGSQLQKRGERKRDADDDFRKTKPLGWGILIGWYLPMIDSGINTLDCRRIDGFIDSNPEKLGTLFNLLIRLLINHSSSNNDPRSALRAAQQQQEVLLDLLRSSSTLLFFVVVLIPARSASDPREEIR